MDFSNSISGRAIPVRGNDIDTDRIIPARFLRCITFEGLGEHSFEDDRIQLKQGNKAIHSFDNPKFQGASILLVNKNFGCGSSREHAPQALKRWGINIILGESFAEIFFGNCLALGIPCVTVSMSDIEQLMTIAENDPEQDWAVNVKALQVITSEGAVNVTMPSGPHESLVRRTWDATTHLLTNYEMVEAVAKKLPYVMDSWKD